MPGSERYNRSASQAALADRILLARRMREVGLGEAVDLEIHENLSVLVNTTGRGAVRVHRGFAYAPDRVLEAIVTFVRPGASRSAARDAEKRVLAFPVHEFVPPRKIRPHVRRARPTDRADIKRLRKLHRQLNQLHFAGGLKPVPIRISHRMRTKLGEITLGFPETHVAEITVSRKHLDGDGWEEVRHTLLHEMVHQWQTESGMPVDHGEEFRQKARQLGISPAAARDVEASGRAGLL